MVNRTRADWLVAVGVGLLAIVAAMAGLTANHPWGDDFAGYLLQARALSAGDLAAEVRLNQALLLASDGPVGPSAYPWGFPLLLWLGGWLGGSHLSLKAVGLLALGVTSGCTYLLGRFFLSRALAVTAAALVGLQPELLGAADQILSDLPFLGVATAGLLVIVHLQVRLAAGRGALGLVVPAAVLSVLAYTIRSNGVFLPAALAAALGITLIAHPEARRAAVTAGLLYAALLGAMLLPYMTLMPDGSMEHARLVTVEGGRVLRRLDRIGSETAKLVPFTLARHRPLPVTLALMVATGGALWGAWRHRFVSVAPFVWLALSVALLLSFPISQGLRYLFPLLPAAAVLSLAGLRELAVRVAGTRLSAATREHAGWALAGIVLALLMLPAMANRGATRPYAVTGPYSPAMAEAVEYLTRHVPDGETVAFFKPRALRLLSGRHAILVRSPEHMDRAQWFLRNKLVPENRLELAKLQLPDSIYADSTRLHPVFENDQFVLYRPVAR